MASRADKNRSRRRNSKKKNVRKNYSQEMSDEMKKQMDENLNGANPVLYISAIPGFHQPFKSDENWQKSKKTISQLWSQNGTVKDVSFQRLRNGRIACFIQFEEDTLNPDVLEELRNEGHFVIQGPLYVRKDWDYSRGQPKRTWDYNVSVSRYEFLNAEERKARRQARKQESNKVKFVFKKGKKKQRQQEEDSSSDSDSDDDSE